MLKIDYDNNNDENNLKIYSMSEYDYDIIKIENLKINNLRDDKFQIIKNTCNNLFITQDMNDMNDDNSSIDNNIENNIYDYNSIEGCINPFNTSNPIMCCEFSFPFNFLFIIPYYEKYANL